MLQFLQPLWLVAAAAVLVPVLIHLWNIRQGKTLKVGSVSLLLQSSRQQTRSLRIRDWLLLLLRCYLIMGLALLLAGPSWKKELTSARAKGWILVEKSTGPEIMRLFSQRIDSLLQAGLELRLLEPGFPPIKKEALLSLPSETLQPETRTYWTLLQMLQKQSGPEIPLYLFTTDRLSRFRGTRPALALNLHWQTFTPSDSMRRWLAVARLLGSDSLQLVTGTSTPSSLQYSEEAISATRPAASGYRINFVQGRMMIEPTGTRSRQGATDVDTATLRVRIYDKGSGSDGGYLAAALEAIRQYTGRKISTGKISEAAAASSGDWLFWLSGEPVPASQQYAHIFRYAPGKEFPAKSWIEQTGSSQETSGVALYKRIAGSVVAGDAAVLWEDAFTRPLLTRQAQGSHEVYTFYSRLDPQWNDLPWREEFPRWMLQLLFPVNATAAALNDTRSIHPIQALPLTGKSAPASKVAQTATIELDKGLWLLLFGLLCLERFLTFRQKTTANT